MRWLGIVVVLCVCACAAQQPDIATFAKAEASAARSQGHIPGLSVALLHDGRIVYAHGFGYAELDNSVPGSASTVYRINSITKAFTATAILQLVEKGDLRLDDHVSKWFPQYTRPGHDPTVHQLLSHSAGLTNYRSPTFDSNIRLDLSAKEWVDSVNGEHLYLFIPGTDWSYSNVGYDLLGLIVERVSGGTLEHYFQANIFAPAGIKATGYCNTNRVIKDRAFSYQTEHGATVHAPSWGTYGNASDRLCSSVLDLAAFLGALESGKLISRSSLQQMRTPSQLDNGRSFDYAFGTRFGHVGARRLIANTGSGEQWTSAMVEAPSDHWTVIVLCNADTPGWQASRIAVDILRRLTAAPAANGSGMPLPAQIGQGITGLWTPAGAPAMEFGLADGHLTARPMGAPVPAARMLYLGDGRFAFGPNGPMEGIELDFHLPDLSSVAVYHDGIFEMLGLRSAHQ